MDLRRLGALIATVLAISLVSIGADSTPDYGISVYAAAEQVRGYYPRPALVTESHLVQKAKFPATDVHCHWSLDEDPEALIRAMDDRNVHRAINLSGGNDREGKLGLMLDKFHRFAPDRLLIFCNPDLSTIDEADFEEQTAKFLESAASRGAAGVKIWKNLGLTLKDGSGKRVPVDDPRLDVIWSKAAEFRLPVLIHTADPVAFFQPIDRNNERWMQLKRHPDWSFYGDRFPDRDSVLAERNRVVERHPQTVFIAAHMGGGAEDLQRLSGWLEKHPNLYADFSGRVAELGRQPYTARKFLIEHQDRILFGTDRFPGRKKQPRYRIYFRFLETADEYFDYYEHDFPPTGQWKIYGVFLPDGVLKKIYRDNALRILPAAAGRGLGGNLGGQADFSNARGFLDDCDVSLDEGRGDVIVDSERRRRRNMRWRLYA
jgi:predicted TIM-barrel fold metal-dependent hydrolase